ncbi:MAG: alpha/beta fold hydrolase [Pseudomonadales bacterium]|nr:alpha/beta fold hydrolase [Pseudomonadales bacterium]
MKPQWRTFALGWLIILCGSLLAHSIQTSNDIRIQDLRFAGANGKVLSAYLYIPPGVDAQHPAPGILAIHGYINSREVQSGFAIEFARRGYVVLAMDQAGHGYSDAPAFADGFGGPAGLAYLRSLDIVDKNNIGLEGHSMGGWAILAAATAYPNDYHAMVLEGSSVGASRSAPGTPEWPRNVAVVFSQFDEFAGTMWQVPKGSGAGDSANLKALFGTTDTVVPGQVYGEIPRRTARVLYSPPVTHPGDHLSRTAIGHALDWFGQTLVGGKPLPANDQIWMWKELGTLTALAGFVVLLCGSVRLLLGTSAFSALNATPGSGAWQARSWRWWALLTLSALIPVAGFYPLMRWGGQLIGASSLFPQTISSQVAFWAVVNGVLLTLLGRLPLGGGKVGFTHRILASVLLALATVGIGYGAVLLADFLFQIDFRFWFVGIKPLSLTQLQILPAYLVPFTLFFLLGLRALHGGLSVSGDSAARQYASNLLALAGGFTVFLLMQYGSLFLTGFLLTPNEPLNTIVMLQFVPLLSIVAIISTYTYRRTASYVPGALINALFVSWYIVAGQATQFPV